MRSRRITFENREGVPLAARLDAPVDEQPQACALFAHCFTCSKNLQAVANISRALTRQGIAVLRFDFAGLGESEGDFEDTNFSSNIDDLVAAARFMEGVYEAPRILIGHSLGGAAVLHAVEQLEAVEAVVTIAAPYDPQHVKAHLLDSVEEIERTGKARVNIGGRPFTVTKQFLDDLEAHDPEETIRRLGRPLLLFHSPIDQIVGIDNARHIFVAARHPKSFVSLDHADHLLSDRADSEYVGTLLAAWARKYVHPPETPAEKTKTSGRHQDVVVRLEQARYRTEVLAQGFPLVADEPSSHGGTDAGPNPYDYLLTALGTCTAMTLRMYADRKEWPLESTTVRLRHKKIHAKDCAHCETKDGKIDRIEMELAVEGPLDEAQRDRLMEIAYRCPVHRTLKNEVDILMEAGQEAPGEAAEAPAG